MELALRMAAGLLLSGAVARYAYRRSSLSGSGAISAVIMGTGFFAFGGPVWFGLLLAFFGSSTYWSKWKRKHKAKANAEAKYAKSGRRDAGQVWANGGIGLVICVAYAIWQEPALALAYVGVMAAVNADTWATEIGALSRTAPRSILTWRKVEPGTSGGVTLQGSLAALGGAAFIGAAAAILAQFDAVKLPAPAIIVAAAALAGFAGAFVDSLLGATVQAMYRCSECGSETERQIHCGKPTRPIRGVSWMSNDAVNLVSSVAAGGLAIGIGTLLT